MFEMLILFILEFLEMYTYEQAHRNHQKQNQGSYKIKCLKKIPLAQKREEVTPLKYYSNNEIT